MVLDVSSGGAKAQAQTHAFASAQGSSSSSSSSSSFVDEMLEGLWNSAVAVPFPASAPKPAPAPAFAPAPVPPVEAPEAAASVAPDADDSAFLDALMFLEGATKQVLARVERR